MPGKAFELRVYFRTVPAGTPSTVVQYNSLNNGFSISLDDSKTSEQIKGFKIIKEARTKGNLVEEAEQIVKSLSDGIVESGKEYAKKLKSKMDGFVSFQGPNSNAVYRRAVDLASQHITALKTIAYRQPISQKVLDESKAFEAIIDAYCEKSVDLSKSSTIDELKA